MLLSPDRLDALHCSGLLDSPCEEAFDRLTRLASTFLSAPICLISLVDRDRQFFKSAIGLPELAGRSRSTPLDCAFCRRVVETGRPLILEDVREHPLTATNQLIVEAGVVAYAGIPLRTPAQHVLGTLCVIDVVPRRWTDREIEVLSDLAAAAMTEIALRTELTQREQFERDVVERALLIERERMNAMFDGAPAFMAWTRGRNHVIQGANRAFRQLVGFRDIVGKPVAEALPEVATSGLLTEVERVVASAEPFVADGMRMLIHRDPGGEPEERFLNFVYKPLYEDGNAPTGILCHGVDVTDQMRAAMEMESSERYHRHLLDTLPVIVYQAAPEPPYQAIYVNKAIEVLGYPHAEWLTDPELWTRSLHPDDSVRVRREAREAYRSAVPMDSQYRMVAKDGTVRWFHDRGEFLPDRTGERCVWQGIMLDITERREAEEALRQSEARHRLTFDEAGVGMAVCFVDGRIERANRALATFLGYTQEELEGMSYLEVLHPDDAGVDAAESARLFNREITHFSLERRYRRKDGGEVWGQTTVALLRDAEGTPVRRLAQLQDITDRKRAELALRASEAYNRKLLESAHEGIWIVDQVGVTTYANPRMCDMLGYEARDLEGRSVFEFMTSDSAFQARTLFARRQRGISEAHEFSLVRRDGAELFALLSASPVLTPEGEFAGALAMITDITERRRTEQALRESEARYRHVVAHAPGMVYQWTYLPDGTGRYTFVSEGAEAIFGVTPEEALRDPEALLGLIPDEDRPRLREKALEAAAKSGPFHWEGRVVLRSGEERYIEIAARDQRKPDGTVLSDGIVVDVTDRRQLEQQLRQAQKMEAVGRLAGGVAHDFNNLITVIKASASFLLADLDAADARADDVRHISHAADRAAGLTRQLLAFSRKQILNPRVLALNSVIENIRPMLSRLIGEDVVVEARLGTDVGSIMADVGQLEQSLINLVVNARDAMPDGGRITIETAAVRLDEQYSAAHSVHDDVVVLPGRYAMLAVTDTGSGMTPDIRARVFEPFFTTKPAGKGTGLGLPTVYGIVKQSGGHIWVYSEPGHGTVFKLYFPLIEQRAAAPLASVAAAPTPRGSETVLLVEDEEGVRRLARRILERQGYTVLESRNGREALELATRHEHPIHLVLTDVIMPEMSGRGLAERLRAVRPQAAVVYMSGYTDDDVLRRELFEPGSRFVQKPFLPEDLLRLVREALDGRS